jgi:hypothetical protein
MGTGSGYAPWVGAGTGSTPYDTQILQLPWQARAEIILGGHTCWNPVTGGSYDNDPFQSRNQVLSSVQRVINTGSGVLAEILTPPEMEPVMRSYRYVPLLVDTTLEQFVAHVRTERDALVARFVAEDDGLAWTEDPINAAIATLDELRLGDAEAQRLWEYYRYIFTPALPTPDGPNECYVFDHEGNVIAADIARCLDLVNTPDELSNQVRRAELCYWIIIYTECDESAAGQGF